MLCRTACLTAVIVLAIQPICREAQAAGPGIFVDRSKLACLAQNAGVYLALDKDPMVIFLDACPDPSPAAAAMSSGVQDSGLPQQAASAQATNGSPVTGVLILTRAQLKCLASQSAAIAAQADSVVRVDQLSCM